MAKVVGDASRDQVAQTDETITTPRMIVVPVALVDRLSGAIEALSFQLDTINSRLGELEVEVKRSQLASGTETGA